LPASQEIENRVGNPTCRLCPADFDITNDGGFSGPFFWRFRNEREVLGEAIRALTNCNPNADTITEMMKEKECVL
jgi:hypothetical protein